MKTKTKEDKKKWTPKEQEKFDAGLRILARRIAAEIIKKRGKI